MSESINNKRSDSKFKNRLIIILVIGILVSPGLIYFNMSSRMDDLVDSAYFITDNGTHQGVLEKNYKTGKVEIISHVKLFYATMFSFKGDSFNDNVKYAKDNLVDYETGATIDNQFVEGGIHSKLVRANAEMITMLDSIEVNMQREPYQVLAYCTQFIVDGRGKSAKPFINRLDIVSSAIPRSENNVHGLQISNWENIKLD